MMIAWLVPKLFRRYHFLIYLLASLVLGGIILTTIGWWQDISITLKIETYGYDLTSMMTTEQRYQNVAPENIEKVDRLLISHYGVGWPLKVMMMYPFYMCYFVVIFFIDWLVKKLRIG
jgi:hypothetical protein